MLASGSPDMLQFALIAMAVAMGTAMTVFDYSRLDVFVNVVSLGVSLSIYLKSRMLAQMMQRDSSTRKRTYEITFGLVQGYGGTKEFALEDVVGLIKDWVESRAEEGLPVLTGHVSETTMIYPFRNKKAGAGANLAKKRGVVVIQERAIFTGSLTPKHDKDRADVEVLDTLSSLAYQLGLQLLQHRVYYTYLEQQYSVDINLDQARLSSSAA